MDEAKQIIATITIEPAEMKQYIAGHVKPIEKKIRNIEKRFQARTSASRNLTEVQDTLLCHADVLIRSMSAPDPASNPDGHAAYENALQIYELTSRRAKEAREAAKKAWE